MCSSRGPHDRAPIRRHNHDGLGIKNFPKRVLLLGLLEGGPPLVKDPWPRNRVMSPSSLQRVKRVAAERSRCLVSAFMPDAMSWKPAIMMAYS